MTNHVSLNLRSTDLTQIQTAKENSVVDKDLHEVADQFEAIFIEHLLKQARESKLSDGLFDNNQDDNFVEMFDKELANHSSKWVDIGIADTIIRQMSVKISESGS
jgi:flagellar protein FlgJ